MGNISRLSEMDPSTLSVASPEPAKEGEEFKDLPALGGEQQQN